MSSKEKDDLEAYARETFGVELDKRRSLSTLQAEVKALEDAKTAEALEAEIVEPQEDVIVSDDPELDAMNDYALRIWEGQSSSADLVWRVERIKAGLAGQGFTRLDEIVLPVDGYKKYL